MMQLYNTMSRQTEELVPLSDNTVKLYTCGLTVYSQPHIGNWIGYIYWDILIRVLRATGYTPVRTQNITDVGHLTSDDDAGEDKMEKGAKKEGKTAWDVAEQYSTIAEHEAYEALGLLRPDFLVRATDYIPQQIAFAEKLEKQGFTYLIEGEGLYFDTAKISDYGKLARLDIDGLEAGARVSVEGKKNPTDFAIWKLSPTDSQRDMEWQSPWGKGFPGWHLECSVIARETLGDQIDIHTGGIDHIPVHHTNEIAQTEAVTNKPFSSFWVHNNHLKADGKKMSKSLGNIYTLGDIAAKGYSFDAFKVFAMTKHYRSEGNFTWENLESAHNRWMSWRDATVLRYQPHSHAERLGDSLDNAKSQILKALTNDLDTMTALTILDTTFSSILQNGLHHEDVPEFTSFLMTQTELLGLSLDVDLDVSNEVKDLLQQRLTARKEKDWDRSDAVRAHLEQLGIGVRDTSDAQYWHYIAR